MEYAGELMDNKEGEKREVKYKSEHVGCFTYYFKDGKKSLW